jgi:DNA-damage-inducible protein J
MVIIMIKDTTINVRINSEVKNKSETILNELGLSLSTAIDLYLTRIIQERGIPFEIKLPSVDETEKALKIGKIINSFGGVETNPNFDKIIYLFAKGDISYEVALFAIKEEFKNG